jgi:hypothetical protein
MDDIIVFTGVEEVRALFDRQQAGDPCRDEGEGRRDAAIWLCLEDRPRIGTTVVIGSVVMKGRPHRG